MGGVVPTAGPGRRRGGGCAVRRQDGDGRAEVLGRLLDFAGQELDLPAERGEPGGDLPALDGLQRTGELGAGFQEFLEADHRARVVAALGGAEQRVGCVTGVLGLDDALDEFLQRHLGRGLGPVELREVGPQDTGRDWGGQHLAGFVFVGVVADHLPARCVRVASERDHRRVVLLDQVGEGDRLPVRGVPGFGELQLAPSLRGPGPFGPHLLLVDGQRGLVLLALVEVGEVAGDEAVVRPDGEVRPQGPVLGAFARGAGRGRPVEHSADRCGGGGQSVQHGPPPLQVSGGRQLVERMTGGIEQGVGARREIRGVRLHGRPVSVGTYLCRGVWVDGAAVAVAGHVQRGLGLAVDDRHPQSEVAGPIGEVERCRRRVGRGRVAFRGHRTLPPPAAVRWTVGA